MFFFKKFSIILSDDFNFAILQKKYDFKLSKINLIGYDLIHNICFENNHSPSYLNLFSHSDSLNLKTPTSLVSPVHLHVGMNGLSLSQIISIPEEISNPFLERLNNQFGIAIKILDNNFWVCESDIAKLGITVNPYAVYSYLYQNINHIHDDQNLNEIQMFIRQDPIYELSKQYSGQHINSLWFWGINSEQKSVKNSKARAIFNKTFGSHTYFDALLNNFKIENQACLEPEIHKNKFKSNNLLICNKDNQDLVLSLLEKYKKNVVFYYRKNRVQIR